MGMKTPAVPQEPGDAITTAENALRELIEVTLGTQPNWLDDSGLTPDRIELMRSRLVEERSRRQGGVIDERLLYYSDLTDIKTVVDKKWPSFKDCLGDKKTFDVYMDRLIDLRIAQMHGRELLPFERLLVAGISGEFRNMVTIFRAGHGPDREYFARIEYVRDSFGNTRYGTGSAHEDATKRLTVRPGDVVAFDCYGWDPEGGPLSWQVTISGERTETFEGNSYTWNVSDDDIAEATKLLFTVTSARSYHRHRTFDDILGFVYTVLPRL